MMIRRILSFALLTTVIWSVSVTQLTAHDEFRIIGTVTKLENSQLQVKTKEGKSMAVKLDGETFIHRDKEKEKVSPTELKAGRSVVVDALGDSEEDLLALEIRIVPTIVR
jgi:hypothetical protein